MCGYNYFECISNMSDIEKSAILGIMLIVLLLLPNKKD